MKRGLAVIILIGFICIVAIIALRSNPSLQKAVSEKTMSFQPSPMVYPLYDMTIPALRQRQYESRLDNLDQVSETDTYISYVTRYTSDGLKINGLLTKPKGQMPSGGWPAIVFVHGYIPPRTYQTLGQPYARYVDYLARNGFVVFKIDLRGHGESEGQPGGAYYSPDYVIDTLNAYNALAHSNFVNSKKIGLWGHSMAGNITLRSEAVKPDIPALVIWAGAGYSYVDLTKYRITDSSYDRAAPTPGANRRGEMRKLYGDPDPSKPFWRDMAPTSFLSDIKGAIEVHHAVDDQVVSIGYSRDLQALLDKTSIPHEFYEYSSGGHNISDENFDTAMERTVAFYKKYL